MPLSYKNTVVVTAMWLFLLTGFVAARLVLNAGTLYFVSPLLPLALFAHGLFQVFWSEKKKKGLSKNTRTTLYDPKAVKMVIQIYATLLVVFSAWVNLYDLIARWNGVSPCS